MEKVALHILNLQPELRDEFFANVALPANVNVKVYKTFKGFLKGIKTGADHSSQLLLFLPDERFDSQKARRLRLAKMDSPIYIVTRDCSEKDYLAYLSLGVSGIFRPPFGPGDFKMVLDGRGAERIPFPRNNELIREGQVRLDFLLPSRLSRILGVNRLVSFLSAEFGFPVEECKVNLPLVMDEALSNAIVHGNKGREDLKVRIRIYISSRRIVIHVEDQGEGFMHEKAADPTGEKNIYKDSGRGIYLIRSLMDKVKFSKGGRVIEMEKMNPFFDKQDSGQSSHSRMNEVQNSHH